MLNFHTKDTCPTCKKKAKDVSATTLSAMVKEDYKKKLSSLDNFFYCQTQNCKIVYFKINELIKQEHLIKEVGLKKWANPKTVCYCFDWTQEKIEEEISKKGRTNAIEDISEKMNTIGCACEINNPSGQCCLKDVKRIITEVYC